jgi:TPR repeat protein
VNLGALYGHGTKEEQRKAVALYRKAAEKGFRIGQYNLGYVYLHGKGVEKDEAQAANWVRKAAEQGLSEAQLLLGEMYRDGQGVKRDRVQAWAWFDTSSANDMNPLRRKTVFFSRRK